jgi:SAM-dependent methyltransferase
MSYMGRWSRLVAQDFLGWLDVADGKRWLDVGCGTGALTETVLASAAPAALLGVDPSLGFVRHAVGQVSDPRAAFVVGDAQALPVADDSVEVVVSALMLNFVPDRPRALAEMRRAVTAGGVVAAYVWDYPGGMQLMSYFWDAAAALDPAAVALHEGRRFDFCRPDPLRAEFVRAGLGAVEVEALVVPTTFSGFDEYWSGFLGGQGPAPAYAMSLGDAERSALQEALRSALPAEPDGSLHLTARAWGLRGRA